MRNRLKSKRGETLIETLTAILLVAISTLLLATLTMTAARLNAAARQADTRFQTELAGAETGGTSRGSVTLKRGMETLGTYAVDYAADPGDALTAYRLWEEGA